MLSVLYMTRLTDDPEAMLKDKINDAIDWVEKQEDIKLSEEQKEECYNYFDSLIEEFEENGLLKDALSFVDNLLVNHDYCESIKEIVL